MKAALTVFGPSFSPLLPWVNPPVDALVCLSIVGSATPDRRPTEFSA
jgi:hypothetical protein